LSAQQKFSASCKRLLAALSLAIAATLAASALESDSRSGPQSTARIDPGLLCDVDNLIEDEQRRYPDGAVGNPQIDASASVADLDLAAPLSKSARPPQYALGTRRTHRARSGLTRAPPLA
jgi:hypothetical protein